MWKSRLVRPYKELKGFAKIHLAAGETGTVTITLNETDLSYYDPAAHGWVSESGEFELLVGTSSQKIDLRTTFSWEAPPQILPELDKSARLHVGLTLATLLEDPVGQRVLNKHFGNLINHPQVKQAMEMSLEQIAELAPQMLPRKTLMQINTDLGRYSA